jgi:hypothetical protein
MMLDPALLLALMIASSGETQGADQSVLIPEVPHVVQKPDFCGEACAEMYLRKLGVENIDQDRVFDRAGVDPSLGRGAWTDELKRALEGLGFDVGRVWTSIDAAHGKQGVEREWQRLLADLHRGTPSIVCMHFDDQPNTTEHFRLVLGFDVDKDEVIFHEPAEKNGAYRRMKKPAFLALWPFKPRVDRWTIIRLRLALEDKARIIDRPHAQGLAPADFAQHVLALKEKLPAGFQVVVEPPFVVIGNETMEKVKQRAERTVRRNVELLKMDFFDRAPDRIIDVWLLKDRSSYEKTALRLTGELPDTPYGFYVPRIQAMVMNIAPGPGTLVHEIVHPFVEADFPQAPAWLNEGLGSIYEYPIERNGHLVGHVNWRLPALQHAIRERRAPSLRRLIATSTDEFYNDDTGLNYAAARYLLFALQEKGELVAYYRKFRANVASDPTGYATLLDVLGEKDLTRFEPSWQRFVLHLERR